MFALLAKLNHAAAGERKPAKAIISGVHARAKVFALQVKPNQDHAAAAASKSEPAKAIYNGAHGVFAAQDALQVQLNAQETDTNLALPRAHGKISAQMQIQIQKTCNAEILNVTMPQISTTQQKLQLKQTAQTAWTMTATGK